MVNSCLTPVWLFDMCLMNTHCLDRFKANEACSKQRQVKLVHEHMPSFSSPASCSWQLPAWVQAIAAACFNVDPDQRPGFKDICDGISALRTAKEATGPNDTSYPMHIL